MPINKLKYYIYLARCSDGSLYTGYTNDLKQREHKHNLGLGAAYTRSRGPVKIVYFEKFKTKIQAMRRERAIKSLKKAQKEDLINKKTLK